MTTEFVSRLSATLLDGSKFDEEDSNDFKNLELYVKGNIDEITLLRTALISGEDLNQIIYSIQLTPLQYACKNGFLNSVRILLQYKVDINISERRFGYTALHLAVMGGYVECVRLLLSAGADIFAKANDTKKAALHYAADSGSVDCLKELLGGNKNNIDEPDINGQTPLHLACIDGNINSIKLLLDNKANPDIADAHGQSCRTMLERIILRHSSKINVVTDTSSPSISSITKHASTTQMPLFDGMSLTSQANRQDISASSGTESLFADMTIVNTSSNTTPSSAKMGLHKEQGKKEVTPANNSTITSLANTLQKLSVTNADSKLLQSQSPKWVAMQNGKFIAIHQTNISASKSHPKTNNSNNNNMIRVNNLDWWDTHVGHVPVFQEKYVVSTII